MDKFIEIFDTQFVFEHKVFDVLHSLGYDTIMRDTYKVYTTYVVKN